MAGHPGPDEIESEEGGMSGYTDKSRRAGIVHQAEHYLPTPEGTEIRGGTIEALIEAIRDTPIPARPAPSFDDLLKFEKVKVALDDQMFVTLGDGTRVPYKRRDEK